MANFYLATDHRELADSSPLPDKTFLCIHVPCQGGQQYAGWYISHDHDQIVFKSRFNANAGAGPLLVRWANKPTVIVWRAPQDALEFSTRISEAVSDMLYQKDEAEVREPAA